MCPYVCLSVNVNVNINMKGRGLVRRDKCLEALDYLVRHLDKGSRSGLGHAIHTGRQLVSAASGTRGGGSISALATHDA